MTAVDLPTPRPSWLQWLFGLMAEGEKAEGRSQSAVALLTLISAADRKRRRLEKKRLSNIAKRQRLDADDERTTRELVKARYEFRLLCDTYNCLEPRAIPASAPLEIDPAFEQQCIEAMGLEIESARAETVAKPSRKRIRPATRGGEA